MNPLRWRKMTWAILIFTGLMVAWVASAVGTDACSQYAQGTAERENCELGEDIGTGIGVGILGFVWFVGFIILSIIWFMTKGATDRGKRLCPACGKDAKEGQTVCKKCGFDFAAHAIATGITTNSALAAPFNAPQIAVMQQCSHCGESGIDPGARFCPKCGTATGSPM